MKTGRPSRTRVVMGELSAPEARTGMEALRRADVQEGADSPLGFVKFSFLWGAGLK